MLAVSAAAEAAVSVRILAQFKGRLDGDPLSASFQFDTVPVRKQAVRKTEAAHGIEPGQFVTQAGDASPARTGTQLDQRGVRPLKPSKPL